MTQQSAKKEYNTFVKGIITEAGPLTFPENSAIDIENVVLNREGSLQRRLGMDFEDDYVIIESPVLPTNAVACCRWYNADNNVDNQFAVVQMGPLLHICDANASSISGNRLTYIDMTPYVDATKPIQVASGLGRLFVVSGVAAPTYIEYDSVTETFSVTQYPIMIRDLFGVDDGLAVDTNPATLSVEHHYNLRNQGWSDANITAYFTSQGTYPSNAQQWFVGKDSSDNFDPALLVKQDFGTTPAPKGRFAIDSSAYSASRQAASGLVVPFAADAGRPATVAFAFERLFYSGTVSQLAGAVGKQPNTNGFIYFSRTMRSVEDAGQCYSDADPTSEIDSELVATDGGYINIPNCGQIYKLMPKGDMLLVFAEQGIWGITGDEGGFRGTSYQVVKLSSFGVLSASNIVDTEDSAFYWNRGGIYTLVPDEATGRLVSKNITEGSIQTLFNSIDQVAKETAVGSYDPVNRRLTWMYNDSDEYTGTTFRNKYNKELVLDVVLGCFYKNSISSLEEPSPYIAGYLETPDFLLRKEGIRTRGDSVTKYLVVQFLDPDANVAAFSFSYYRDPSLKDWKSLNGIGTNYDSFVITGYETMGDSMRNKIAQKLVTHFKRTEREAIDNGEGQAVPDNPSSCLLQTRWDWSDSANSGKWSEQFQAYRLRPYILTIGEAIDYGYEVVSTKHTVPGRGKALSIKFSSDEDKDFYLYGWAIKFTGQTSV